MTESSRTPQRKPRDKPRDRPRVAVVFGGRSSEHAISCITAGSVLAAIDPEKYDVVPVGIARDGRWVLESGDPERLQIASGNTLPEVDGSRASLMLSREEAGTDLVVHEPSQPPHTLGEVDVVFPVLHGPWGQDGTLQGMLELAGIRYVGAGVLSSAVGTDKLFMKLLFAAQGLPILPYVAIRPGEWERDPAAVRESVASLGYPVFVSTREPGKGTPMQRLTIAQDTGGAIRGAVRADYFFGNGQLAANQARRMKERGQLWILLPRGQAVAAATTTVARGPGGTRTRGVGGSLANCLVPDDQNCADD